MFSICLNKKVLLGVGAVAMGVLLFAPQWLGAALPLLLIAVCPLSMLLMMKAISGGGQQGCADRDAQQATVASTEPESIEALEERLRQLRAERAARDEQLGATTS